MSDSLFSLQSFLLQSTATIISNPVSLFGKFQEIQRKQRILDQLEQINIKLDEVWLVKAQAGINHLIDGINCNNNNSQLFEFQSARRNFNELISLNKNSDNYNKLRVVGYWGNYHYFNLLGNYKNSLLQAYQCTLEYPDISLMTFPKQIFDNFPGNYPNLFRDSIYRLNNIKTELIKSEKKLKEANNGLAIATGVGVGVVAAGLIAPWLIPMGLVAGLNLTQGVAKAGGQLAREREKYQENTIEPLKQITNQKRQTYQQYLGWIQNECDQRIEFLSKQNLF